MAHFKSFFISCIGLFLLVGCQEQFTPKPRGYFRIQFPEKTYTTFQKEECPFKFDYPVYAEVKQDEYFFEGKPETPCWLNVEFGQFAGTIHLSYKPIKENYTLAMLIEDAHVLTSTHTIKAEYIDETIIQNPHHVGGLLYDVGGDAASALQFFLTDSTDHFMRGALYFNATPNADSIAPVVDFVRTDLMKMIDTFEWTE